MSNRATREFEIIVWGATGFTGKLVAQYLLSTYGSNVKWAIAGRNAAKLEKLRQDLVAIDRKALEIPIVTASISDMSTLETLTGRTAVLLTTVGPYYCYGKAIVKACVATATHYTDITGEVAFVRDLIDEHHDAAVQSGTKIVPCCGWDSIPADLGAHMMVQAMKTRHNGVGCSSVRMVPAHGSDFDISGGTLNTIFTTLELPSEVLKSSMEPYALNPKDNRPVLKASGDQMGIEYDKNLSCWTNPWPLASTDARIVRRSAALLGYGNEFDFSEAAEAGGLLAAVFTTIGLGLAVLCLLFPPTRWLAQKLVRGPGQGPSVKQMETAQYRVHLTATPDSKGASNKATPSAVLRGSIVGSRDPGYKTTAAMVSEAALCLARQGEETASKGYARGGVLSPAAAMGMVLVNRINQSSNAHMKFTV